MKDESKRKHRKFLFSLLIGFVVAGAGVSSYAVATGQMPAVLQAVTGVFNTSACMTGNPHTAQLQITSNVPKNSYINPEKINPSNSISHETSSQTESSDPDAKEDEVSGEHSKPNVTPSPISVTPGKVSSDIASSASSTSSKPAPSSTSSSNSSPSEPTSSSQTSSFPKQTVPSTPVLGHSGSGGHRSKAITGVALDKETLTLNKGETSELLKASISPSNATGNKTITWKTNNPEIATVDQSGKVTAVGAGTTQVVAATANGKTASCTVTVLVPPDGIKINAEDFSLDKGVARTLTATVTPSDCTNKTVIWATSNNDVVSVDSNGKITGISPGKAVITATTEDQKYTSSCNVTVVISISSLTLDQTELNMIKGTQTALTATINPPDTTEKPTMEWTSSNPVVATVDDSGVITAVEGGVTTITAKAGSHVAECKVTVTVPATGIAVNKSAITLAMGKDEALTATVFPEDTSDKAVQWTSSDESVATVDSFGKILAVKPGTAIITATTHDGGFTAFCTVTVIIPVTGISLDKTSLTLIRLSGDKLTPTITPADATDQAVIWESSDESIATVDNFGNVKGVGAGCATIRAITHDGNISAECQVTVTPIQYTVTVKPTTNGSVTGAGIYDENSSVTLTATPSPHYHFVKWINEDGSTAGTNSTYVINRLNSNVSVSAQFEVDTFTVMASGANGTITGGGTYSYGTSVTLTAVPNPHFHFVSWNDGVTTASRTVTATQNISLIANFVIDTYTVSVSAGEHGSVSGGGIYPYGSVVTLSATPYNQYKFLSWSDGVTTANRSITVTGNMALSASFCDLDYKWTASLSVSNVDRQETYISNSELYGCIASFSKATGSGTAHAVYTFNSPTLLRAGTIFKAIQSFHFVTDTKVLLNGVDVMSVDTLENSAPSHDHGTRLGQYVLPVDTYVTTIEIQTSTSATSKPYANTALWITPPGEKTFVLNNSGTSAGQDCTSWYYMDVPTNNNDNSTYVSYFGDQIIFSKICATKPKFRYIYAHFLHPQAIDHIVVGESSSYESIYNMGIQDIHSADVAFGEVKTHSSSESATFNSSNIFKDWDNVMDLQIRVTNYYESVSVPVTIYYKDGHTMTLGTYTAHGSICS
ncbi:Ig-like domain-containing protein [Caproiciproducens sp. LBM24188]